MFLIESKLPVNAELLASDSRKREVLCYSPHGRVVESVNILAGFFTLGLRGQVDESVT
jgi:hypothetical protein